MFNRSWFSIFAVIALGVIGFVVIPIMALRSTSDALTGKFRDAEIQRASALVDEVADGGQHYKPLHHVLDLPGICEPVLKPIASTSESDDELIVGVVIDGQAIAFLLKAMAAPDKHIVNASLGAKAVTVAYCDLADCVRVFQKDTTEPIPMRNGGLNTVQQMVLLLDESRYDIDSDAVPLAEVGFLRISLGEWKRLHPDSLIFTGRTSESW